MCLAIPMEVIKMEGSSGTVSSGKVSYNVSFNLLPDAKVGDYVIVHAGFAIQLLDRAEADERIKLFKEMELLS